MSCFKITKGLCRKVTVVISTFRWAGKIDKRGFHWQAWDKMVVPKYQGRLGFRDLELFNDIILAKKAWRLLENPNSPCAWILQGRYYSDGTVLTAGCPQSASPVWRAIICGRDVLKQGLVRHVGNGMTTEVWHDNWISRTRSMRPTGCWVEMLIQTVTDIIAEESGDWQEHKIREVFMVPDAEAILSMPGPRSWKEDIWAWEHECFWFGRLTVCSLVVKEC